MVLKAISVFFGLTILTGVIYPLSVSTVASLAFPSNATGSLIIKDGEVVGSELIGQQFSGAIYFWGRPSATGPYPYNSAAGSGSNLAPSNPKLLDQVQATLNSVMTAHDGAKPVPVDLVTSSGSGLDPHISVAAAEYQVKRVARARNLDENTVSKLVVKHTEQRYLGLLGEPRVNVLLLNLDLDTLTASKK